MNIGKHGEDVVVGEYLKKGYRIIGRNIRLHLTKQVGELDVICTKDRILVFVEVKTRTNYAFGLGVDSVNYSKQRKLVKAVRLYLAQNRQYKDWVWRLDVAEVYIDSGKNAVIILENVIEDLD